MTSSSAVSRTKSRLGITDTSFDTLLAEFFTSSINRLEPRAMREVAVQSISISSDDYGEANIDLGSDPSTPLDDLDSVEGKQSGRWWPIEDWDRHGSNLRLRNLPSDVTQVQIYGLNAFDPDGTDLPTKYELPVIWLMMAEFFDYLASNKSNYDIYTQQTGARAVDNMQDESLYYEQKADAYIEDRAQRHSRN